MVMVHKRSSRILLSGTLLFSRPSLCSNPREEWLSPCLRRPQRLVLWSNTKPPSLLLPEPLLHVLLQTLVYPRRLRFTSTAQTLTRPLNDLSSQTKPHWSSILCLLWHNCFYLWPLSHLNQIDGCFSRISSQNIWLKHVFFQKLGLVDNVTLFWVHFRSVWSWQTPSTRPQKQFWRVWACVFVKVGVLWMFV